MYNYYAYRHFNTAKNNTPIDKKSTTKETLGNLATKTKRMYPT